MEKGPFSIEWLAQSSCREARPLTAALRLRYPPGGPGGQEAPADPCESCPPSRAGRAVAVSLMVTASETVAEQQPHVRPLPTSLPAEGGKSFLPHLLTTPSCSTAALRDREITDNSSGSSPRYEAEPGRGTVPARPRTKFSAAQLQELEGSFREQRYIGAREKRRLAAALNLSQSQVKTWFQNRRMKFKRQTQDARVEALFSGLFLPHHCYTDTATSSYSHERNINVSSTSTVSLHPAMSSPVLLPSVPAQSLQPVLPSPALLLSPSPGLSCYSSAIPAMTLTDDHKRLRWQLYLPSY